MRVVLAAALLAVCGFASNPDEQFNGRWDISVSGEPKARAWWLEVSGAGTANPHGKFVGAPGGQLDDIPKISVKDGELRFAFERRYRRDQKELQSGLYWARLDNGRLKGTFEIAGEPSSYLEWTGVRAPVISEKDDALWRKGDPVTLFDGRDMNGWSPLVPGRPSGWSVKDGMLVNSPNATNLVSDRKFWNFVLHVEYRVAPHSNSGIGLRGRYEVQILDDFGKAPSVHGNGAIYSRIPPAVNASRAAGEWQTFDIRLVGRQATVVLNGTKIIDRQIIDGLTAIASDAAEAEPGPISLQGDHGPVEFRKIVLYPLSRNQQAQR